MKKPWERAPLDEAVFLQEGPGIRSYEYQKGGYPMINVRCVQDGYIDLSTCNAANVELATGKWKHFQVQEGDILFTISGSIGRTAIVKKQDLPLLMNTSVVRFRSKTPRLRDDFYFYYLQSEDFLGKLHALSSGTAQKNVGPTHLKTLDVPLPPLAEQQRIVCLLDEAFEGLATAKANTEKNLQNVRALFESHLQAVFTQRGPGWVETTLDKISTNLDNKRIPITKNVRSSGEYPYYGASGIVDYVADYIFEGDNLLVSEDGANLLARSTPIAFSVSGKYWVNNHAHILHFENIATQRFVEFYLESIKLDDFITGAAQPKLNQKALNSIPIPIPKSVEAQVAIVEELEVLQEETQRLTSLYERKLAALEALKKALLHQAFAGEL
jgi:type I restriction enzyme S subunit